MSELKYTLDNKPISARDLIDYAADLDPYFANDWIKSTSEAAYILRINGHEVGHNKKKDKKCQS